MSVNVQAAAVSELAIKSISNFGQLFGLARSLRLNFLILQVLDFWALALNLGIDSPLAHGH